MTTTYLPYTITDIYCMVFAFILLFRLNSNMATEHEVKELKYMVISYIVMVIADIIWALSEDSIIPFWHYPAAAVNSVTLMSVAAGCYFWFKFIEDRLSSSYAPSKTINILTAIPLIAVCILDVISIFTGWVYYIDANNEFMTGPLYILHAIVDYAYLLVPTVNSIYKACTTDSRILRHEYIAYSAYMVAPLIAGLLEDYIPTVPILTLNIFLVIYYLFLMIQDMQVNSDALTDLNNRRRFNQYLENRLHDMSHKESIVLFITDINDFKSINDNYGHLEGDAALKFYSTVLKHIAAKYNGFIARYGGDEFCLVVSMSLFDPELIAADIQNTLKNAQTSEYLSEHPYVMTVSIGYTVCDNSQRDPDLVMHQADNMLYLKKNQWHRENDSQI